jgi:hypothetical protein
VKPAVQLDLLALLHLVPPDDEARVFRVFGSGIAGQEVPFVQVPEAVSQVRDGGFAAVRQYSFEEGAIILVIRGMRHGLAVEGYGALTEE